MTITWVLSMITWQMVALFPSTLWALSVGIFHFCISKPSKFIPWGPSCLCIMFWSVKFTHLHAKDDSLKSVNIDIFFLHKIRQLSLYDMFCLQFGTNFVPISWLKYFEESFWAFFALNLLCNISNKFSIFCLFVF